MKINKFWLVYLGLLFVIALTLLTLKLLGIISPEDWGYDWFREGIRELS